MVDPLPEENSETPPPDAEADAPSPSDRPDWLIGADDGAQAELDRKDATEPTRLHLVRPVDVAAPAAPPSPPKPTPWRAAASSVPILRRADDEDVKKAAAGAQAGEDEWALPGRDHHRGGIDDAIEERPMRPLPEDGIGLPDAADDVIEAPVRPARPAVALRPLKEPMWAVALDSFRSSRSLQLGVLACTLAVAAFVFWPRSEPTLSIAKIRKDPSAYDGLIVHVKGRIGEVFPMGAGFAFNLHQGRDTIVVFTRSRKPVRKQKVDVAGTVSMGYLDGVARPSLFENTP
jgi:hypothetical protein